MKMISLLLFFGMCITISAEYIISFTKSLKSYINSNYSSYTTDILIHNDTLWIATYNSGILALNLNAELLCHYSQNNGLPDSSVSFIEVDREGNKWIVSGQNIIKFDGENWTTISLPKVSQNRDISSIYIDSQNRKWFGTVTKDSFYSGGEIIIFDDKNWFQYDSSDGIGKGRIKSIVMDNNGDVWVGTDAYYTDGSLCIFREASFETIKKGNFTTLSMDNLGNIWSGGSMGEINKYSNGSLVGSWSFRYSPTDFSYINEIAFDKNNNLWVASENDGIGKFDGDEWVRIHIRSPRSIAVDSKGQIWCGTDSLIKIIETPSEPEEPKDKKNDGKGGCGSGSLLSLIPLCVYKRKWFEKFYSSLFQTD